MFMYSACIYNKISVSDFLNTLCVHFILVYDFHFMIGNKWLYIYVTKWTDKFHVLVWKQIYTCKNMICAIYFNFNLCIETIFYNCMNGNLFLLSNSSQLILPYSSKTRAYSSHHIGSILLNCFNCTVIWVGHLYRCQN